MTTESSWLRPARRSQPTFTRCFSRWFKKNLGLKGSFRDFINCLSANRRGFGFHKWRFVKRESGWSRPARRSQPTFTRCLSSPVLCFKTNLGLKGSVFFNDCFKRQPTQFRLISSSSSSSSSSISSSLHSHVPLKPEWCEEIQLSNLLLPRCGNIKSLNLLSTAAAPARW